MSTAMSDIAKLRVAILSFIVLVAAGAALLWYAENEKKLAVKALATAKSRQQEHESRLRQVRSEEDEIKNKAALFNDLSARGIIGQENRLEWLELLREVREKRKLFAVDYDIAPQQSVGTTAGGYDFRASMMRLSTRLLHEEEFLQVLDDIRGNARALVLPKQCALSRIQLDPGADTGGTQAHIRADCALQFVTIRPPVSKP